MIEVKDSQRRGKRSSERVGRRLSDERNENFGHGFEALGQLALQGVQVSARAVCLSTGRVLFSADDHVVMPTAGVGKVLLLIEVAARLADPHFNSLTLLDRTAAGRVLAGFRGAPPADAPLVVDVIRRLAQLALDWPQIQEIEINPLIVQGAGAVAVDARVRLAAVGASDALL